MLALLMAACSHDDPAPLPPNPSIVQKTIFVFMPWTSNAKGNDGANLYSIFQQNLRDMQQAIRDRGGMDGYRGMVFIADNSSSACLYEMKYVNGEFLNDTLKRYKAYDNTTPQGIAALLNEVKTAAPADTYGLIIGCHGTGWIPKGTDYFAQSRAYGGTTAPYQTEVSDLAKGIEQAGMHMQFISFDDCYMAGVEVAYDLRNVSDWLIASTSEIMAAGMPYKKIWQYVTLPQPDYRNIVGQFYEFYNAYAYPYGTLSVINLKEMDNLAQYMRNVNATHRFETSLTDNIQKLDGFRQTVFFDLGSYATLLMGTSTIPTDLATLLSKVVPWHAHTPQIFTAYSSINGGFDTVDINTFSGITISDATQNTVLAPLKTTTAWWQATHN